MASSAVSRFWEANPKPAQLNLFHWAEIDSIETMLFLGCVNKRWRELRQEWMLSRLRSTKVKPGQAGVGLFGQLPELVGDGYIVVQATGACYQDGLLKINECRYPMSKEGRVDGMARETSSMKLKFDSYDAATGLSTFLPVKRNITPMLELSGMASTEAEEPFLFDDVAYNSFSVASGYWFKDTTEPDSPDPENRFGGDEYYSSKTPKVLHGLELAVPLRKGWQLVSGPALVIDIPPLPTIDEDGDLDDLLGQDVEITNEKLSYKNWTYSGTACNFGLPPDDEDVFGTGMTRVYGVLIITRMSMPLLCVRPAPFISHRQRCVPRAARQSSLVAGRSSLANLARVPGSACPSTFAFGTR